MGRRKISADEKIKARAILVEAIAQGDTIVEASKKAGVSEISGRRWYAEYLNKRSVTAYLVDDPVGRAEGFSDYAPGHFDRFAERFSTEAWETLIWTARYWRTPEYLATHSTIDIRRNFTTLYDRLERVMAARTAGLASALAPVLPPHDQTRALPAGTPTTEPGTTIGEFTELPNG